MIDTTPNKIDAAVHSGLADAVELSRSLYREPELAYHEVKSSQKIVNLLRENGYQVEYPFLEKELGYGTAFRAVLKNGEGPSVAILTEYDALPGLGHACGHNLHGAMSTLAGMALAKLTDQFQGTVYVIGTPAEEENGAKVVMEQQGVFKDMALAEMIHSYSGGVSQTNMEVLSLRCYEIEFHGLTAHSVAGPWHGHSALAAARKFLDLVDARRECFTPDVFVNSIIQEGGRSPNIIPDTAKLRMEFRTNSRGRLEQLDEIVRKCAQGAALALDCTVTFEPGLQDFWDMVRVSSLEQEARAIMECRGETVSEPAPACGSSDIGNVSYQCPSIQMLLSITDETFALHTEGMREATQKPKAFEQLEKGACVLTELALRTLNDARFRMQIREDFQKEREIKDQMK